MKFRINEALGINDDFMPRLTHCESKIEKDANGQDVEIIEAYLTFIREEQAKDICDAINNVVPSVMMTAVPRPPKLKTVPVKGGGLPQNFNKFGNKGGGGLPQNFNRFGNKGGAAQAAPAGGQQTKTIKEGGGITLKIHHEYIKDIVATWADKLDGIIGNFKGYVVGHIGKQLISEIAKCPTQEDIRAMEKNIGNNFMEMLKNLADLKVQNKIFAWQVQNVWVKKYGILYGLSNAMRVQMQAPNAQFVTTKAGWAEYNRQIKPNAQRIIINMPNYKWVNKYYKDRAARYDGYKDWDDAYQQLANVSKQMLHALEIKASILMGSSGTHPQIVYDVADTIPPQDPSKDIWAQQMGLSNNLKGALNPAAEADYLAKNPEEAKKRALEQQKQQQAQQQDGQAAPVDMKARRSVAEKRLIILYKKCKEKGVNVKLASNPKFGYKGVFIDPNTPFDTIVGDILDMIYAYSIAKCPEYNIIESKMQSRIAGYTEVIVAVSSGYSLEKYNLKRFLPSDNNISTQESLVAFKFVNEIIPSIKEKPKNESINFMGKNKIFEDNEIGAKGGYMTVDEFIRKIQEVFGTPDDVMYEKKEVKNSFNNLFERINR